MQLRILLIKFVSETILHVLSRGSRLFTIAIMNNQKQHYGVDYHNVKAESVYFYLIYKYLRYCNYINIEINQT